MSLKNVLNGSKWTYLQAIRIAIDKKKTFRRDILDNTAINLKINSLRIKRSFLFKRLQSLVPIQSNMKWNLREGKVLIFMFFFFHMVQ